MIIFLLDINMQVCIFYNVRPVRCVRNFNVMSARSAAFVELTLHDFGLQKCDI